MKKSKSNEESTPATSDQELNEIPREASDTSAMPSSQNVNEASPSELVPRSDDDVKPRAGERAALPGSVAVVNNAAVIRERNDGNAENEISSEQTRPADDAAATRPQSETKNRISAGHAMQPGAIAVAGTETSVNDDRGDGDRCDNEIATVSGSAKVAMYPSGVSATNEMANQGGAADSSEMKQPSSASKQADSSQEDNVESIPMVRAQLVVPPVEAVQVCIDEENNMVSGGPQFAPFEMEQAPSQGEDNGSKQRHGLLVWVLLVGLVAIVACAVAIPVSMINESESKDDLSDPCYTSTLDILMAQLASEPKPEVYVICPNTRIKIGTFKNPAIDDYTIIDGDYPILIVRENVKIQCGRDGRRENNCVLDGGFIQVHTNTRIPTPNGVIAFVEKTDNLTVRGITFTGTSDNVGPFGGQSIVLSYPGRNIRFEDCMWTDMVTQWGVVGVGRNYFQELTGHSLEPQSIDVTFSDCIFQNIVYDHPAINILAQSVTLERCLFRNFELSALVTDRCAFEHNGVRQDFYTGCAVLLFCGPETMCTMKDVCVERFDGYGPGLVGTYDLDAIDYNEIYLDEPEECELALLSVSSTNETTVSSCSTIFDQGSCPFRRNDR